MFPDDLVIPLLRIYPREMKIYADTNLCVMCMVALFNIAKMCKGPKYVSIAVKMVYPYNGMWLS